MGKKQEILDKALELFNERGIEYVGLRELAAALNMRIGNLNYYFPTKDDLVFELSLRLTKANSDVFVPLEHLTLHQFLEMLRCIFQNHWRFRCFLLSFVHLMGQNKRMAESYKNTQSTRNISVAAYISTLGNDGYLQMGQPSQIEVVVGLISLVSRFGIAEAAISFRQQTPEEQMRHYLRLVAGLLQPYVTAKGKPEIEAFLQTV